MQKRNVVISIIQGFLFFNILITGFAQIQLESISINSTLEVQQIAPDVWLHVSYKNIDPWGLVGANGLIIIGDKKVALIDTPWNSMQTKELVSWIKKYFDRLPDFVVVTHFHNDNLGGLDLLHKEGVDSYSLNETLSICHQLNLPIPKNGFTNTKTILLEPYALELFYPGEGHSRDNIAVMINGSNVLFAGCLVKAQSNQTLGNLADANVKTWKTSLQKLKQQFPNAKKIIPGHGAIGDIDLIDHTITLVENYLKQ